MTTREIAARMHAQEIGPGRYKAKCQNHNDKRPSVSISEGEEGKTLVFCWALCPLDAVVSAAGLSMRDLFNGDSGARQSKPSQRAQQVSADDVKQELSLEAQRTRTNLESKGISGELWTRELNAIRRRVAARTGVKLEPLPYSIYEGGYGGRDRDPLWPLIFEAAWERVCIGVLGFPIATLQELSDNNLRPPPLLFILSEDLAAAIMRDEESSARRQGPSRKSAAA